MKDWTLKVKCPYCKSRFSVKMQSELKQKGSKFYIPAGKRSFRCDCGKSFNGEWKSFEVDIIFPETGMMVYDGMRIFSEGATDTAEVYPAIARENGEIVIGGVDKDKRISVIVTDGTEVYRRLKYRLPLMDIRKKYVKGKRPPRIVKMGGKRILPLICYEICFPDDWPAGRADYIVHIVGFPMKDQSQFDRWRGLQEKAVAKYKCPLICVCGKGKGVDPTGVIDYKRRKR